MERQPRIPESGPTTQSDATTPDVPLQAGLGFRLSRLTRALRRIWADELSELGLSPPQAAVLRGVAGNPGCSLRALARILATDPMNAKRCVDELEQRGLIRSGSRPGDRRPRTLALTEDGRALAHAVDGLVRDQESWMNSELSPVERDRLEAALTKLEVALDLVAGDSHPAASNEVSTGHS